MSQENEMSFLQHLEVLRWHIMRSIVGILVFAILAFIFKDIIFDQIILAPKSPLFFTNRILCEFGKIVDTESLCINQVEIDMINIKLAGQFSTHISVSLVAGFLLSFPYVFFEFWRFVMPALTKKERANSRGTVFFTSLLFTFGALFGYYIIVPLSLHFLGSYSVSDVIENKIGLDSYIETVTMATLSSAVVFELPIFIFFLTKIGMVTPATLKKYRKHAIVIILIVAAVITPPDIFSQILVSIPLMILYEVSIKISKRVIRKQAAMLVEEERLMNLR